VLPSETERVNRHRAKPAILSSVDKPLFAPEGASAADRRWLPEALSYPEPFYWENFHA
jgi:hypothetical protein